MKAEVVLVRRTLSLAPNPPFNRDRNCYWLRFRWSVVRLLFKRLWIVPDGKLELVECLALWRPDTQGDCCPAVSPFWWLYFDQLSAIQVGSFHSNLGRLSSADAKGKRAGQVRESARMKAIEIGCASLSIAVTDGDRVFAVGRELKRQDGVRLPRIFSRFRQHFPCWAAQDKERVQFRHHPGRDGL